MHNPLATFGHTKVYIALASGRVPAYSRSGALSFHTRTFSGGPGLGRAGGTQETTLCGAGLRSVAPTARSDPKSTLVDAPSPSAAVALLPAVMQALTAAHTIERGSPVRSAEAVVKLLPRKRLPEAIVAPNALATSATETGQKQPE